MAVEEVISHQLRCEGLASCRFRMTAETVLNAASKTISVMSHSTSLINTICAHMLVPKHLFTGNYIYSTH